MENMVLQFFSVVTHILFPDRKSGRQNISSGELLSCPLPEENLAPSIYAFFKYKYPSIRKSIWRLKYYRDKRISQLFGKILYSYLLEEFADQALFKGYTFLEKPLLIPMPLSTERREERGYNQCEFFTKASAQFDTEKIFSYRPDILLKIKDTPHQTNLPRFERIQNLSSSFSVQNKSAVKNKIIFLIDDVTTTGSTFAEASRVLYASGAQEIFCIALAH